LPLASPSPSPTAGLPHTWGQTTPRTLIPYCAMCVPGQYRSAKLDASLLVLNRQHRRFWVKQAPRQKATFHKKNVPIRARSSQGQPAPARPRLGPSHATCQVSASSSASGAEFGRSMGRVNRAPGTGVGRQKPHSHMGPKARLCAAIFFNSRRLLAPLGIIHSQATKQV